MLHEKRAAVKLHYFIAATEQRRRFTAENLVKREYSDISHAQVTTATKPAAHPHDSSSALRVSRLALPLFSLERWDKHLA